MFEVGFLRRYKKFKYISQNESGIVFDRLFKRKWDCNVNLDINAFIGGHLTLKLLVARKKHVDAVVYYKVQQRNVKRLLAFVFKACTVGSNCIGRIF